MYVVRGRRRNGGDAYVANDTFGSGFPYFADEKRQADVLLTAQSAIALARQPATTMKTYHRASEMDLDSFAAHEAVVESKPVRLDEIVRGLLADEDRTAPQGWSFVVRDAEGRMAAPERHWSPTVRAWSESLRLSSLREAVAVMDRLGDGWCIHVSRLVVSPEPVPRWELDLRAAAEKAAMIAPAPEAELPDEEIYSILTSSP